MMNDIVCGWSNDNMFDVARTIQGINSMVERDGGRWVDEDPWVVDAIRGSILETGWRGTLTEYFVENPDGLQEMCDRVVARLEMVEALEWHSTRTECPRTSLKLDPIGLGTYGWKYDPDIIHEAVQAGIWFIDTAETYGYGRVETVLGNIVTPNYKGCLFIATKVSRPHLSYQSVLNAADRSLDRLKISSIDLYQVHKPNPKFPIQDTMRAMVRLLDDGKVMYVGVCNFSVDQIMTAQQALYPYSIQSVQVRYNLLDRGIERALLPYCQQVGIMIIAYSPLGQKFSRILKAPGGKILTDVARRCGATEAQVALAWIMSHPGVVPIPRTNKVKHVHEVADSVDIELESGDVELLNEAFPIIE